MSAKQPEFKCGRVVVTERGIQQLPVLLMFGEKFNLVWDQICQWSSTEMLQKNAANGTEKVIYLILELRTQNTLHTITMAGDKSAAFGELLTLVRHYLPGKETSSILQSLRGGV